MAPSVHASSRVERAAGAPQVLIVDDDREMRGYLRRCLRPLGPRLGRIHEAGDGLEALEVALREGVGLVITDVVMPRLDGLALTRQIANRAPQAGDRPIVLLVSGQINPDQARMAGAVGLVPKPFDGRTLRNQVLSILDRRTA